MKSASSRDKGDTPLLIIVTTLNEGRSQMSDDHKRKLPAFLKTVYLSTREIRLILAGLYSLNMPKEEVEGTLWKKLLFEKLHKKTRRKKN
jgi:hypothetical protein